MEYKSWYRDSSSGEGKIFSCVYEVEEPKAIFQIAHGMCEHIGRYDEFARALADAGYLVCGNDHLGHGESHLDHLGTFALKKGGFDYVIQDIDSLFQEMQERYPDVPCVLLGHSMGSILAALFAEKYHYLHALILMGAPVQNEMTKVARVILAYNVRKHGYNHTSKFCNYVMWGAEPTTIEEKRKNKSWLSYNKDNIERFINDEKCNFSFSDSANLELVKGLRRWGKARWRKRVDDIPILVIAGKDDKIGKRGKGPRYYYKQLQQNHTMVELYLIKRNRHEILNEDNRADTYRYILEWLEESL